MNLPTLNEMIQIKKTDASNTDFITLVAYLDQELAGRDGEEHAFYDQFNKISNIRHAIVLYVNAEPVGCGAIKKLDANSMEVKRMFIKKKHRGEGLAQKILVLLEKWSFELGYKKCVLETGKRQPEAVNLYMKSGYTRIPNYGQYMGVENSLCFEKQLQASLHNS